MSRKAVLAKQAMGNGLKSEKTGEAEKVNGEKEGRIMEKKQKRIGSRRGKVTREDRTKKKKKKKMEA